MPALLFILLSNTRWRFKLLWSDAIIQIRTPDTRCMLMPAVNGLLALFSPQLAAPWKILSLWFSSYAVWTVTNRIPSVLRVKVKARPLRYQSPLPLSLSLIHPPFLLHPSVSCFIPPSGFSHIRPQLTLCGRLFTPVRFSIPSLPLVFLAPLPPVLSSSFTPPSFQPCQFLPPWVCRSLCHSNRYFFAPLGPPSPPASLLGPALHPSSLCPSLLSFTFILSSPLFPPLWHLSFYSLLPDCPSPYLCLIHFSSHLLFP